MINAWTFQVKRWARSWHQCEKCGGRSRKETGKYRWPKAAEMNSLPLLPRLRLPANAPDGDRWRTRGRRRQAGRHWFEPVPPTSKGPGTGTFLLADVGAWGRGTRCLCWHRAAPEEHRFSDKEEPVQSVRLAFANRPGWSSSTRAPMGCGRRSKAVGPLGRRRALNRPY